MLIELDFLRLFLVSLAFFLICWFFFAFVLRGPESLVSASFVSFFFIFNAFGVADVKTEAYLAIHFLVSVVAFLAAARFGSLVSHRVGATVRAAHPYIQNVLVKARFADAIIFIFIAANMLSLVVPEFRLHLLFALPELDIRQWFERQLAPEQRGLVSYFLILLGPMYFLSIMRHQGSIFLVFFLLLIPIYFEFVREGYIGRYEIMFNLMVFWMYLWILRPKLRVALLLVTLAAFPFILISLQIFSQIRLGVSFDDAIYHSVQNAFSPIETEITFLQVSGNRLIESGQRVDLISYFTWLLTLPLPGFIKSELPISLINFEISEIVLGLRVVDHGFFVLLPGLLAESIFIYGELFFFVHFVFLGFFAGVISRVFSSSEAMFFLHLFFVISFGLVLNRGGVSALAPRIFTEPILLVVFLLFAIYVHQRVRQGLRH